MLRYAWGAHDTLFLVALRFFGQCSYVDIPTFVTAIRQFNFLVLDWQAVPAGTLITLPLGT